MSHIYRVWQKWVYSYEYAEQSLFLYYYMLIIVLFPIQTTVNLLLSLPVSSNNKDVEGDIFEY